MLQEQKYTKLKNKDVKLIQQLRKNGRETLTNISKATNIPISTLHDMIKDHTGYLIKKHTALLDFNVLGYFYRTKMLCKVAKENRNDAENYLLTHDHVNSVFKINNGYDFLIDGVFSDIKQMHEFVETLEDRFNIENLQTHPVLKELGQEMFMEKRFE
jgi:DNA-binding Lrp family transcriptional regulator